MNKPFQNSELDQIIPPEIKHDEFYAWIEKLAQEADVKTVLEIGSSSGSGSTEAFVKGARENPHHPSLFCLEISRNRFSQLQRTYADFPFVRCYNLSSVTVDRFPSSQDIIEFYNSQTTNLNQYSVEQVLNWLKQDIEYVKQSGVEAGGIQKIKSENQIEHFDIVLIDGSEFTGNAELQEVYGATYILLDDIKTFKNWKNYQRLLKDSDYRLIAENYQLRNGYAIFKKNPVRPKSYKIIHSAVEAIEGFMVPGQEEYLFNKVSSLPDDAVIVEIGSFKGRSTVAMAYACLGTNRKIYSIDTWDGNDSDFSERNFFEIWKNNIRDNNLLDYVVPLRGYSHEILSRWHELVPNPKIDFIFIDGSHQYLDVLKDFELSFPLVKENGWIAFHDVVHTWPGSERVWHNIAKLYLVNHEYSSTLACGQKNSNLGLANTSLELPIHFFTIVLNGEPFIRYHLDVFQQLSCKWHWHIIEGVADLKHDTAWSLQTGGTISAELHNKGRSNDGTSEYLDELAKVYPNNITIYRKPEGVFWEGKREMVNAPLKNIQEECLLWQIDIDELWTVEQIYTARQLFITHPKKTAAFYWCWYFVGENLVLSTRNGYGNNPQQEWLRTWRFKPGMIWVSHEPPRLAEPLENRQWRDVAAINSFTHQETEKQGLVFQHFSYVTVNQLEFKEKYYGYKNVIENWQKLQNQKQFPVELRQYFSWVQDQTQVNTINSCDIVPLAYFNKDSECWQFRQNVYQQPKSVKVIVDGVFFQLNNTGIARVWKALLKEWVDSNFTLNITVLDRAGTAPKIPGIQYQTIPAYDYNKTDVDRQMLQQICDQEQANLFISTYYTTPLTTPSVFMAYDMIPEIIGHNLDQPMWREKHRGILHASAFIAISENTARDLVKFFPQVAPLPMTVAHCGVDSEIFYPATSAEREQFKTKYGISKPYFCIVGERMSRYGYKNAILFFKAFSLLENKNEFEIVCVGGQPQLESQLSSYVNNTKVHLLKLSDDELRAAYSEALALVYPSKYEGFGLPILEAMACGCPVITCQNSSILEAAGQAAIYVAEDDSQKLIQALKSIQNLALRRSLIEAGLQHVKQFSWSKMADTMSSSLLNIAQNIKEKITIVTSIAPNNLEKQKTAIASWKSLGFSVVSLNTSSEIKQLKTLYENVTFHPVTRDAEAEVGKPLIYLDDILSFLQGQNSKVCGIVNSDVQLKADEKFYSWVLEQAENAVVFGSRIDIESSNELPGEIYDKGFDFFFFNQQFLTAFPKTSFCLGLPWWDFLIPLTALQQGWTLKRLVTPIAYHVKHSVNYSNENWQKYGILFVEFFNSQLSSQLREQHQINPVQLQGNLIKIANQFLAEVHKKSIALEYQPLVSESDVSHGSQQHNPLPSLEPQNMIIAEKNNKIFPSIEPLNTDLKRPLFSVMIPTFNKVKYLEKTLKSVLEQAFTPEEMQIEVINDHPDATIQSELEAIVNRVSNRVKFYRHPEQNIGQTAIFNLCLQRAQGYWIHLLHDDDFVLPGFYQSFRTAIEQNQKIGAAFCRHFYVDENNRQRSLSFLERETPGLLENWLEKIATSQRIQPSSIVVKRSTYERLGGFCKEAGSAADWEMWKRIAAYFPIWYEPKALACYRLHSTSWTSRLLQTGGNILDTLKSIEISQSYLPPEKAETLSKQAREHYAFYALNTAKQMLGVGEEKTAVAQIKAAVQCSQSQPVKDAIIQLFSSEIWGSQDFNGILKEVTTLSEQYRQNPKNITVLDKLRKIRQTLGQFWLNTSLEKLDNFYTEDCGKIHQTLLNTGIKNEPLTEDEQLAVNQWIAYLSQGLNQPNAIPHLLATMLYCYPHQLPSQWYKNAPIPNWFVNDYLTFMLTPPHFFQQTGEVERYYSYLKGWVDYLHSRIFSDKTSKTWQDIANVFLLRMNAIPLYFSSENIKDIYIKRAEIMELALLSQGNKLDYTFPKRSESLDKIRLGILSTHWNPQTETYSTLPVFEHLDRNQFEIILYTCQINNHPLEKYCQSRADRWVKLPQKLSDQVKTIRADDLDILLIGTNVTAVTHSITLLALHRLARIQVTSTSSCVTTGMRNIDYYISGNLTESPQAPQQYSEKLAVIEGTAHCFNYYAIPPAQPTVHPQRSDLKLDENTVVFISGANFYKIIPELRETWAKILSKVPNSVLILYPFNPNWTSNYARIPFLNTLKTAFERYNVKPSRLMILDTQPSRTDIKQYLKLADVYLDSYPFSGVNSLVDPLEVGLVTITQEGDSFRSKMGSSLLKSLALNDLIVDSEDAYINLAVQLATDAKLRQQYSQNIAEKMQKNPPFLDSYRYSKKMESLFKQLFNTLKQQQEFPEIPLNTAIARRDYLSELVHHINLYTLNPSEEAIIERLRQLRKVMAEYWLKISPDQLEEVYKGHMGNGYQVLLSRGIQHEALIEAERQFVDELTQVATGLKHPNSLNCLMAAMLYYVPGKMLVRDAEKRLPSWLIKDYQTVFENQQALQKVEQTLAAAQVKLTPETLTQNTLDLQNKQYQNRLQGCLNLYRIDPSNQSVVEELRQIRRQLADFWLTLAETELESVEQSSIGKCSQFFYRSDFIGEPLTEKEQEFYQQLITQLSQRSKAQKTVNFILAARLYSPLEPLQIPELLALPSWLK